MLRKSLICFKKSTTPLIPLLANAVRDVDLKTFKKLSSKYSNNNKKQDDLNFITLRAAYHIKSDKPEKAAQDFTKIINLNDNIVDDPVFLANLAIVFLYNNERLKSNVILSMIPQDHPIWREQAEIWYKDINAMMRMKQKNNKKETKAKAAAAQKYKELKPEKKSKRKKTNQIDRKREEELILLLKNEIAEILFCECVNEEEDAIGRLLKAKEKCREMPNSKAIDDLRQRIDSVFCMMMLMFVNAERRP